MLLPQAITSCQSCVEQHTNGQLKEQARKTVDLSSVEKELFHLFQGMLPHAGIKPFHMTYLFYDRHSLGYDLAADSEDMACHAEIRTGTPSLHATVTLCFFNLVDVYQCPESQVF